MTVHSNEMEPEMRRDVERAARSREPLRFDDGLYLVQRLEEHADTGAGTVVVTYELIPLDDSEA